MMGLKLNSVSKRGPWTWDLGKMIAYMICLIKNALSSPISQRFSPSSEQLEHRKLAHEL